MPEHSVSICRSTAVLVNTTFPSTEIRGGGRKPGWARTGVVGESRQHQPEPLGVSELAAVAAVDADPVLEIGDSRESSSLSIPHGSERRRIRRLLRDTTDRWDPWPRRT